MPTATRLALALTFFAAAAPACAQSSAVNTVAQLYRDFAWEAVVNEPSAPGLAQQPKAVLLKYFTPALASALAADATCTARHREVCALDFAPLWASQDPGALNVSVVAGAGPAQVKVRFVYPSTAQVLELTFRLAPTKAGWRIADIVYPSGSSLAKQLAGRSQ